MIKRQIIADRSEKRRMTRDENERALNRDEEETREAACVKKSRQLLRYGPFENPLNRALRKETIVKCCKDCRSLFVPLKRVAATSLLRSLGARAKCSSTPKDTSTSSGRPVHEVDETSLPGRRSDSDEIRFVQLSHDKIAAVLGGEF